MGRSPPKNSNACAFVRVRPSCPLVVRGHTRSATHRTGTYRPIELEGSILPRDRARTLKKLAFVRSFVRSSSICGRSNPVLHCDTLSDRIFYASDEYVRIYNMYNFSTRSSVFSTFLLFLTLRPSLHLPLLVIFNSSVSSIP